MKRFFVRPSNVTLVWYFLKIINTAYFNIIFTIVTVLFLDGFKLKYILICSMQ